MANQNTTSLPELDMSTSVPLSPTSSAQTSALPELDMSTSVPIDRQTSAAPAPGTTGVTGVLNKIGEVGGQVETGFEKGVGDTVSGIGHLLNKIPSVGEILSPTQGLSALDKMDVSEGTAESAGKGLEGIAEFAAGDELMEGLSKGAKVLALAKKYPLINEMMIIARDHPLLAKIIAGAGKGAVVGGVEGGVKGAQQGQAGRGAAVGAGAGAVAGTIGAGIKALPPNPFRRAFSAITKPFTGSDIQPALKTGIQDVWNTVADTAGVARPVATSVQDLGQEVGDSILARSKANYRMIDMATEGRFSGTEQALKAVNQDLRSVTNDAEEQALLVRKTRLEMQMDQTMNEAEAKGVSKIHVDAAKKDFKQAQAIYDTNHQIRMSTTGVRPGMQGATEVPEEVNARSLMNRLNKLHNSGRIQQAIGADGAEDLIGHSAIAQKAAKDAARNRTVAKVVGGVVGVPAAGTAVVEGVRHLLE